MLGLLTLPAVALALALCWAAWELALRPVRRECPFCRTFYLRPRFVQWAKVGRGRLPLDVTAHTLRRPTCRRAWRLVVSEYRAGRIWPRDMGRFCEHFGIDRPDYWTHRGLSGRPKGRGPC